MIDVSACIKLVALVLRAMIEYPMLHHGVCSLRDWPLLEEPGTRCAAV